MPVFFFDLDTPAGFERAEEGLEFDSLEAAFLSAYEAAVEMAVDLLRDRQDASRHRFEVRDAGGVLVFELPFTEILKPRAQAPPPSGAQRRLSDEIARTRALKAEVMNALERARATARSGVTSSALIRLDIR